VADPPAGQRRTGRGERRRAAGPLGGEIAEPVGGQVGLGPHREHARRRLRRRGVHADDAGMRMGRAHDHGRHLPRQPHVIRISAEALEEAHVLDAAHRLPDGVLLDGDGLAHGVLFYRVSDRDGKGIARARIVWSTTRGYCSSVKHARPGPPEGIRVTP
jgi:hypothetical protein